MVDIKRILDRFEADYNEEKRKECETLYNALIDVIAKEKATIQNVIYVLHMIEFSLLKEKYAQLFGAETKGLALQESSP